MKRRDAFAACVWLLPVALFQVSAVSQAQSAQYVIAPDGSGDFPTIQAAIDAAVDGDRILLTEGVFIGDGNREIHFLGKAVSLESQSGDPLSSILDLQGSAGHPVTGMHFTSFEDSSTVVQGITIQNAWSDGQGGAISISGASPRLRNLRFIDNSASEGAAIYVTDTESFQIEDCSFEGNQGQTVVQASTLLGDELGPAAVAITECSFTDNEGVCVWNFTPQSRTSIGDCEFLRNGQGFQIGTWSGRSDGSLSNSSFRENGLGGRFDGGDFEFAGSAGTLEAQGCDWIQNGRGMELLGGYLDLSGGELNGNAPGGAIVATGESILTLRDASFFDNSTGSDGGAIALECEAGIVERCEFRENEAQGKGGAIFDHADFGVQVGACSFFTNSAQRGGAIYSAATIGESSISQSIFHGNASQAGGAMYLGERPVGIDNCTLVSNRAPSGAHISGEGYSYQVAHSILSKGLDGPAIDMECLDGFTFFCTDIFDNEGGDWTDCLGDLLGVDGNISQDPLFCNDAAFDFRLRPDSPCRDENNDCGDMGAISETCGEDPADTPESNASSLSIDLRTTRNPFVHDAALVLSLSAADVVAMEIYDIAGKRIRQLIDSRMFSAGEHQIRWDGADQGGEPVPAGIYFCVAHYSGGRVSIKLVRESR